MIPVVTLEERVREQGKQIGYRLLGAEEGCVNGCNCGISIYKNDAYDESLWAAHEDQEGFYVLEGSGTMKIGDEEITVKAGDCFLVPAHVFHMMKRDAGCEYCKVFWFHAAI